MTIKEWKNKELNENLMKKWGLLKKKPSKDIIKESLSKQHTTEGEVRETTRRILKRIKKERK